MTAGPGAVFVIHRRLGDHRRPPETSWRPAAPSSPQGGLIYTAKYNDFLNNGSWKAARACSGSLSLRSASAGCPARFWHDSCPIGRGLSGPVCTWGKRGGDYCKITGGGRRKERETLWVCSMSDHQAQNALNLKLASMTSSPGFLGAEFLFQSYSRQRWPRAYKAVYGCILIVFFSCPIFWKASFST